jgi:hypothetical protein
MDGLDVGGRSPIRITDEGLRYSLGDSCQTTLDKLFCGHNRANERTRKAQQIGIATDQKVRLASQSQMQKGQIICISALDRGWQYIRQIHRGAVRQIMALRRLMTVKKDD